MCSLLYRVYPDQSPQGYMRHTQNSKNSMAQEPLLKILSWASVGSNMRRNSHTTEEIMMHGLTMLDLRKEHIVMSRKRVLRLMSSMHLSAVFGRCMNGRLPRYLQVVKNVIGDDIYSCGWTMLYLRKLRQG